MAGIVFTGVAIAGIIIIYFYLQYIHTHITTDDAFIDGNIHTIASKVRGTVKNLLVKSNQFVKAGDVLVEIDPVDYDVKVNEAEAGLNAEKAKLAEKESTIESSKSMLSELKARRESAGANLELQEANLKQAQMDLKRAESLYKKEAISKERYERQQTSYDVSAAQVKAAKEQLKQAEMAIAGAEGGREPGRGVKDSPVFIYKTEGGRTGSCKTQLRLYKDLCAGRRLCHKEVCRGGQSVAAGPADHGPCTA